MRSGRRPFQFHTVIKALERSGQIAAISVSRRAPTSAARRYPAFVRLNPNPATPAPGRNSPRPRHNSTTPATRARIAPNTRIPLHSFRIPSLSIPQGNTAPLVATNRTQGPPSVLRLRPNCKRLLHGARLDSKLGCVYAPKGALTLRDTALDSAFAEALIESETTHAAPARAMLIAFPPS